MSRYHRCCHVCVSLELRAARARDVRRWFNDHPMVRALRAA